MGGELSCLAMCLQQSLDAYAIYDLSGRLVWANTAYNALLGQSEPRLLELTCSDVMQQLGCSRSDSLSVCALFSRDGDLASAACEVHVPGWQVIYSAVPSGYLQRLQRQVRFEVFKHLGELVMHDVNNSLQVITGHVGLLARRLPGDTVIDQRFAAIHEAIQAASHSAARLVAKAGMRRVHRPVPLRQLMTVASSAFQRFPGLECVTFEGEFSDILVPDTLLWNVVCICMHVASQHQAEVRITAVEGGLQICLQQGIEQARALLGDWLVQVRAADARADWSDGCLQLVWTASGSVSEFSSARQLRVLLVEDEPLLGALTSEAIVELGGLVTHCESAEQALSVLEASEYDLLLTDILLAGMSGLELVKRAQEMYPLMRVVIASGYYLEEAQLNNVEVMLKPYDLNRLKQLLSGAD